MTRARGPDVIVGGVPGAGKTTAIRAATRGVTGVAVIDPSQLRRAFSRAMPWAPYRSYRWLVHSLHTLRVVSRLAATPRGARLVIHDPGTRPWRRTLYGRAARLGGRRLIAIYLDPTRAQAEEGQRTRGRIVRSFGWHWRAWQRMRPLLVDPPPGVAVCVVPRADAAEAIRRALRA